MSPLAELRDRVIAADLGARPLCLRGGGTKDFYGQPPAGDVLDTRAWQGIVSYEPTELVVTARCGTPLVELQAALAERQQMLAFEPPAFGPGATIGGVVAAGLSGPRRAASGPVRDFVLGASLLNARGELLQFGGQVMKNVAGYDVSRLLCGSLGILGVISEVSLKVLPVPPAEATMQMAIAEGPALQRLNEWSGKPWPITATAWCDGNLSVRFSGARAAVDAAVTRFGQDHGAQFLDGQAGSRFWAGLREQTDGFFAGDQPLWRVSVPSSVPALAVNGRQLIEWGGALRWFKTADAATGMRAAAARVGGTATLFRGGDRTAGVFHPLPEVNLKIHRRLKHEFDPNGIFNPGRLYPGL